MPQLEFSIWLFNLCVNWVLLTFIFIAINNFTNQSGNESEFTDNFTAPANQTNNSNWPW
uniref:ATP synthase complex subunit 8 n=1 Tax=Ophiacantha linea TaxID=1357420 RepID=V9NK02_9ECHI|nr:ATP synthase F0 subunit 8 [Ophiacantha linea]AGQ49780.1 ATP synthase F0 subunit 8 [Ophiacantha linea]